MHRVPSTAPGRGVESTNAHVTAPLENPSVTKRIERVCEKTLCWRNIFVGAIQRNEPKDKLALLMLSRRFPKPQDKTSHSVIIRGNNQSISPQKLGLRGIKLR